MTHSVQERKKWAMLIQMSTGDDHCQEIGGPGTGIYLGPSGPVWGSLDQSEPVGISRDQSGQS